ncbi:MAG TPA: AraC family transcriptional regulator [Bacillota bacterium]
MDYFCFIQSVVAYVENRLKTDFDYAGLERATGFSLPHTREVFKTCTRMPLARYVLYRKLSNAAFEMVHTERRMLDIAVDYGFESYDTFIRAFKRLTGVTPREFRRQCFQVGRIKLTAGIYGPGIAKNEKTVLTPQPNLEEMMTMQDVTMKTVRKSEDSCILFGVPKVQYCSEECTPFPSVLKACLNYMGQEINYSYLMAASGAAFRLRWNTTSWDGGNVDIMCIYENPVEAFERSFKAAGRSFKILERRSEVTKEDFIHFIKSEIDEGRPVIALGIIGPPEACIISGYRDYGSTLLGWNFFQDNPEFAKDSAIDESGYFVCNSWWQNSNTIGVMAISEAKETGTDMKDILQNAIDIMTKERIGDYAGGPAAYDAWAGALSDESQFPQNAVLPILFERLMCQGDAMDMIGEGRAYAAGFIEWLATQGENIHPSIKTKCLEAAKYFKEEASIPQGMCKILGGWQRGEEQARRLADPAVRSDIGRLITRAKELDTKAGCLLKGIVEEL